MSSFLLYSIGGHNNTAIKISNTYSDDQLFISIFKRQTEQKQWMWAMISFKRDRFNPHRIPFPPGFTNWTGWPSLLRIEAHLGHEGLGTGCFLFYFGVLGTSAEERMTRYWKLHAVNFSLWGVTRATVLRFESLFCNVENNLEFNWREPQNISWVKHQRDDKRRKLTWMTGTWRIFQDAETMTKDM